MMLSLLSIGEVMAEIRKIEGADFRLGFAGDTYNTAVYCSRAFNVPNRIGYMTRIGNDPLSRPFVQNAQTEGLNTEFVEFSQSRNIGIYTVEIDHAGERSFSYWRQNSATRGLFSSSGGIVSISKAQITYLSGITLAILAPKVGKKLLQALRKLKQTGDSSIAFDSNYRHQLLESA